MLFSTFWRRIDLYYKMTVKHSPFPGRFFLNLYCFPNTAEVIWTPSFLLSSFIFKNFYWNFLSFPIKILYFLEKIALKISIEKQRSFTRLRSTLITKILMFLEVGCHQLLSQNSKGMVLEYLEWTYGTASILFLFSITILFRFFARYLELDVNWQNLKSFLNPSPFFILKYQYISV